MLYSIKGFTPTQRHALFKTRCTINGKVSELIIDGSNIENVISKALVVVLNLRTIPHLEPYKIGWVK